MAVVSTRPQPPGVRGTVLTCFYEPILLLAALNKACVPQPQSQAPGPSPGASQSLESLFHDFVNKISQICDSERYHGSTVTSFAVLRHAGDGSVEYRFASNRRTDDQLKKTRTFVTQVLNTVRQSKKDASGKKSCSRVLRQILLFARHRVTAYLISLKTECEPCISQALNLEGMRIHFQIAASLMRINAVQEVPFFRRFRRYKKFWAA